MLGKAFYYTLDVKHKYSFFILLLIVKELAIQECVIVRPSLTYIKSRIRVQMETHTTELNL